MASNEILDKALHLSAVDKFSAVDALLKSSQFNKICHFINHS